MAIKTHSDSPYNDDFATADKNYVRLLFQPGRAVQVRELNQLQSNLQDQIDKFGRHVFKDGDRVLDGYTTYDGEVESIPFTFTGSLQNVTALELKALSGTLIEKAGTNLRAKILGAEEFTGASNTKYYRLYIKYFGANNTVTATKFAAGDAVNVTGGETTVTVGGVNIAAGADLGDVAAKSSASLEDPGYYGGIFQDEGVFFIKGTFVHTDSQSFFVLKSAETTKLSGDAVFDIVETIVTSSEDGTLLDNAAGTPNVNAVGADRYKLALTLNFKASTTTSVVANEQKITLIEIADDKVTIAVRTQYSELGKALAQRTSEESGSYVLKPFKIEIREYYNNEAGNRGKYTTAQIKTVTGNTDWSDAEAIAYGKKRYVLGIEASTAYVQGYRVELENKKETVVEKGRESSDIATVDEFRFQSDRPTTFIEGVVNDIASATTMTAADLNVLELAPDQTYNLYCRDGGSTIGGVAVAAAVKLGQCRIHSIEHTGNFNYPVSHFGAFDGLNTKRVYIYDIQITHEGASISDCGLLDLNPGNAAWVAGEIVIVAPGGTDNSSTGFVLSNTQDAGSLYQLPFDGVKSISSSETTYTIQKRFNSTGSEMSQSGNIITLTITSGFFTSTDPTDYPMFQEGRDCGAHEASVQNVEIQSGAQSVKLTAYKDSASRASHADIATNKQIAIYAPVEVSGGMKTKTQATGAKTYADGAGTGIRLTRGGSYVLSHTDVYEITSITHAKNPNGASVDIKSDFVLDTGQRDSHYGLGVVRYNGKLNLEFGLFTINYKYYVHSGTGSFFAANSYKDSSNALLDIESIPTHNQIRLSNCIDFRPSITDSAEGLAIVPDTSIKTKVEHYLPRLDIVTLNQLGEVIVVQGTAANNPVRPITPKDSISLYTISKPGYVYDLNDLITEEEGTQRYKMSDIANLEGRVKTLEYYASLSAAEQEADGRTIQDESGNRFKNGILTDSFIGHGVGDVTNDAYKTGIDRVEGIARAPYLSENSRWSYISGLQSQATTSRNTASTAWNGASDLGTVVVHSGKRKNSATLDFIEKSQVVQPYATDHISVNPYDVATWSGSLEVSPSSDEWKDVEHRPDIVTNVEGNNEGVLNQLSSNPNMLGSEWSEWTNSWAGRRRGWWFNRRISRNTRVRRNGRFIETFRPQERSGIRTSLVENFTNEVIDDKILDTTFVPFIRSRKVFFRARLLKPNTQFFLYFDDVNVTSYCGETSFVQFGGAVAGAGGTDVVRYDGQTSIAGSGNIITDASGDVEGFIVIPNNDTLRFRTGTRQIRITDNANNNRLQELSSAETSYFAKGLLETRQRSVISTRELAIERTRLTASRNLVTSRRRIRRDPVAQTFMIGNEPTGIFLSSVDVYFQNADPSIPVELSIVTVENGIPTQDTVPFSKVIKKSGDSGVGVDATRAQTATNFMFDTPVYLEAGIEYAIVLISNSARWRVWKATVGGTNKVPAGSNAEIVKKNPNLGVLLKSQNASTWTPDQNSDLKFKLNRADFKTDASQTALFTGICPARGEVTYIDVTEGGSGYLTGAPTVTISGGGGSGATAKAYVSEGGIVESVEVLTRGTGYTSAPSVSFSTPERININPAQIRADDDGIINLTLATTGRALPANVSFTSTAGTEIINIKRGQKIKYFKNGGTAIAAASHTNSAGTASQTVLTDDVVYFVSPVNHDDTHTGAPKEIVPFGSAFALYTDAALTNRVDIDGTGNANQFIVPVSNDAVAGTALINTWKGSTFFNAIEDMVLPEGNITHTMTIRGNDSSTGSIDETLAFVIEPEETVYTDFRVTHNSSSSHNNSTFDKVLKLQSVFSTTDSKISPVIDLERISLVSFDNVINNSNEFELLQDGGESAARYISKRIRLKNPSDQVNIYLNANRPSANTDIDVYVKILAEDNVFKSSGGGSGVSALTPSNATTRIDGDIDNTWDNIGWTQVSLSDLKEIPINSNFEFTEVEYQFNTKSIGSHTVANGAFPNTGQSATFTELAIKIVFRSDNKAFSPEIKNLRAIATV